MSASDKLLEAWYKGHPALALLRPLEWLYRRVVIAKRRRFLVGQSASYRASVPVIVVGNITVGGTGKTPLILFLIEHCRARGLKVGVVSRGYGAKPPLYPWLVDAQQSAAIAGDEPLLIVQRTGAPLVIDPDRGSAVRELLRNHELDLILSDDGLQHYRLARDLELVLIDAARGLGNKRCLPAGPLREPVSRLEAVDAVLLNGAATDSAQGYAFNLKPLALVNLLSGERQALDFFAPGQKLHAVAGIGNPQRFFHTLEALNWQPIAHPFADHAQYDAEAFNFEPALPVVMTEKDAVKCRDFAQAHWWYLAVDAAPTDAFVRWLDAQLDRLVSGRL